VEGFYCSFFASGGAVDETSGSYRGDVRGSGRVGSVEFEAEFAAAAGVTASENDGDTAHAKFDELCIESVLVGGRLVVLFLVTVGDRVYPWGVFGVTEECSPCGKVGEKVEGWVAVEPCRNVETNTHDVLNIEGSFNAWVTGTVCTNDFGDGVCSSLVGNVLFEELCEIGRTVVLALELSYGERVVLGTTHCRGWDTVGLTEELWVDCSGVFWDVLLTDVGLFDWEVGDTSDKVEVLGNSRVAAIGSNRSYNNLTFFVGESVELGVHHALCNGDGSLYAQKVTISSECGAVGCDAVLCDEVLDGCECFWARGNDLSELVDGVVVAIGGGLCRVCDLFEEGRESGNVALFNGEEQHMLAVRVDGRLRVVLPPLRNVYRLVALDVVQLSGGETNGQHEEDLTDCSNE